ncbi:TrbC/VIRB2 family protein [uncultured archaeon]|nr:TrbC/VIRB2 family protein [uncultured archaeon]
MKKLLTLTLSLAGLAFAADLAVPVDQPICKVYSLIQTIASIIGVIMLAYSGFQLIASTDMADRQNAKNIMLGTIIGIVIIWLAPYVIGFLTGSGSCGF